MKNSYLFFRFARLPVDFCMLMAAGVATYVFRTKLLAIFRPALFELNLPLGRYFILVVFATVLFIGAFALSGLYATRIRLTHAEEFAKILIGSSAAVMMLILFIFLRQELFNSRFLIVGGWALSVLFVFWGRVLVRAVEKYFLVHRNFGMRSIAVIGNNETAARLISGINSDPASGYRLAARLPYIDLSAVKRLAEEKHLDKVVLSSTDYPPEQITDLLDLCRERYIDFKYVPGISNIMLANFDIDIFNGLPVVEIRRTRLDGWWTVVKRASDVCAGSAGLVICAPVLAIIAVLVKFDSPGPVFVGLERISQNRKFALYKFRSMVENAEELKADLAAFNERRDGPLFKMKNDPRVTRVGRFIRRYRLDELPQFWNILRGDISLVGPRPHQPDEIAAYQRHHKKVLAIKAGATGLAQVSGSSDLPFEEEVSLDSFYIDNWSFWLDFKIILKTAFKMLNDRSAV